MTDSLGAKYVTEERFREALDRIYERMERMAEATQADIDQITSELAQVAIDLATAQTTLQQEINNLANNHPGVDVTALKAAADKLDPSVQAISNLTPQAPPAPPAPTSTRPVYTFDGDPGTIDQTVWPPANETTNDPAISPPKPLFFFASDTQDPNTGNWTATGDGQGNGQWHLYAGPVAPAA